MCLDIEARIEPNNKNRHLIEYVVYTSYLNNFNWVTLAPNRPDEHVYLIDHFVLEIKLNRLNKEIQSINEELNRQNTQ